MIDVIARQLNDHHESSSGVDQSSYTRWTKSHIQDAILTGCSYLFSLMPEKFSSIITYEIKEDGCLFVPKSPCGKFLNIVSVNGDCSNAIEKTEETNNLLSMMVDLCPVKKTEGLESVNRYEYEVLSENAIQFSSKLVKGDTVKVLCAAMPNDFDNIPENILKEHRTLILNFALWFILLSDSESVSNLSRSERYYLAVADYVVTVLRIEFSLREDDYIKGRRKVDD